MANGTVYRRGSVFGALLLIALGGLFLYANLRPEVDAWSLLARYWPVLIIFWGLGKLVDYLMLRGRPEAARATRLTGGDIVGLVFLVLIGWCFTQVVQHGWWRGGAIVIGEEEVGCLLGSRYEFSEELNQTVTPPTTLTLRNLRGNLTLTAGAGNEIRLVSRKTVCAGSEAEAQRLAEGFEAVLQSGPGGPEFRWKTSAGTRGFLRANIEVQVPESVSVKLSNRRGDVHVSGVQGEVTIDLERGDAVVENSGGDVRVDLHRGSVRVADVRGRVTVEGRGSAIQIRNTSGASVDGSFYGPIRLDGIAGPVRFLSRRTNFSAERIEGSLVMDSGEMSLRGVPGEVTLLTKNKDIEVEAIGGPLRIENRNGSVVIRAQTPPTHPIEVKNRTGGIELILPANSGFEISATSRHGEIESDFSGPDLKLQREDRGTHTLSGTYGTRRVSIRLSTTHGTIQLRRTVGSAGGCF